MMATTMKQELLSDPPQLCNHRITKSLLPSLRRCSKPHNNHIGTSAKGKQLKEIRLIHSHAKLPDYHDPPKLRSCYRSELLHRLKLCGKEKDVSKARSIHADILEKGTILADSYVVNALITAYSRCGAMDKAREVFEKLPVRDVVSWNALITGYAQNGFGYEALHCFRQMQNGRVSPNVITYVCILKACGIVGSLEIGEVIDAEVRKKGLLLNDVVLGTALVDMYSKCGKLDKAREVFENLPMQNVVMWSALIGGYVRNGLSNEALKCFTQMQDVGVHPDAVTYAHILKACGNVGSLDIGEDVDAHVRKRKLLQRDIVLGNALIDMYCKCGAIEKAREVFVDLPKRDVVTWSALISGYAQNGFCDKALEAFRQMQDVGIIPDARTYVCILKACSIVQSLEIGEDIDTKVRKQGLLQKDVVLGTALMDMYCKCGALEKAREVFDQLPAGNVVAWSAIIAGYAQNGLGDEALKCFSQMQDARVRPDDVTYLSVLKACGIVGSLKVGEDIDTEVRKKGALQNNVVLGTALVDMYSKCGVLEKAQEVFQELPFQDIVSWSALMAGYTQLGEANVVLDLYRRMRAGGAMPCVVTFILLLTACSHAGLVNQGERLFDEMRAVCLTPTREHYTCMIDLYVRAGHVDEVKALTNKVPNSERLPLFLAILSACRQWRDVKLGKWAFEKSVQLDENCAAAYVCMENIYATAGTSRKM